MPQGWLPWQWRAFRRLWPGARLLLRVGGYWEAYGSDATWLRERLQLQPGRGRAGLPQAAGFAVRDVPRLRRLLAQAGSPVVVIEQTGYRAGALQERAVRAVWLPEAAELAPPEWLVANMAHRPAQILMMGGASDQASMKRNQS